MTPANSTSFAAYGADSADSPVRETVKGFNVSVGGLSSGGDGVSSDFLARHTTDRSLTEYSQFTRHNDALSRYTTSAVDPVLSIPVREDSVLTHLQWRCASEVSDDDVAAGRTNRDPMPRVVMCPRTPPSDNPTYDDVLPGEAGAMGNAAKIITDVDNLAASARGSVCSRDADGSQGVLAALVRLLDESCAVSESRVVGAAAEVITKAVNPVGSSSGSVSSCDTSLEELVHLRDENRVTSEAVVLGEAEEIIAVANGPAGLPSGSYRCHDAGLEVLVSRYRESAAALAQGSWQPLDGEQRLLQPATAQSSEEDQPTRNTASLLELDNASLARCSLLQTDAEIVQNCALVERVLSGQTRQDQAHAQSPVETQQAEAVPPAADAEPEQLCRHYCRRCYVRFSCCSEFFACHWCHNDSDKCDNTAARASNATHLKCAECQVVQVINEDSRHCTNCRIQFSEYFCARCKHFASVEKKPFHCEKCGICRYHKDRNFHCDVCNVCLDKRIEGKHKCRPDSGHDECCVCLEDAFSGCQVLPCSHKVHEPCGIAMMQNGIRNCPICRHPFFLSS